MCCIFRSLANVVFFRRANTPLAEMLKRGARSSVIILVRFTRCFLTSCLRALPNLSTPPLLSLFLLCTLSLHHPSSFCSLIYFSAPPFSVYNWILFSGCYKCLCLLCVYVCVSCSSPPPPSPPITLFPFSPPSCTASPSVVAPSSLYIHAAPRSLRPPFPSFLSSAPHYFFFLILSLCYFYYLKRIANIEQRSAMTRNNLNQ